MARSKRFFFSPIAAFILAVAPVFCALGADVTPVLIPPASFADTETAAHVAVPPLVDRQHFTVSMALTATPSNSLTVAFGRDADNDGYLSLCEQTVEFGWTGGVWMIRRDGGSAWESCQQAGAAGAHEVLHNCEAETSGLRL